MTSWVVVDSGIVLATVLPEPYKHQAIALVDSWEKQKLTFAAPVLFQYEIVAVTRKVVHRGILTQEDGVKARDHLLARSVTLFMDKTLLTRGYELATQFNRPTAYDAQYLAVAEHLNCECWTADERLFNTVSPH